MGADIHWMIERKHEDSSWHAVLSQGFSNYFNKRNGFDGASTSGTPQDILEWRNYNLFGMLSKVRDNPPKALGSPIAKPGLPEDCSIYARDHFGPGNETGLHSTGYFHRSCLERAIDRLTSKTTSRNAHKEYLELLWCYRQAMVDLLNGKSLVALPVDQIIFGAERSSDYELSFPDMERESSHARLLRIERQKGLLAIADDTVRMIVAYDS